MGAVATATLSLVWRAATTVVRRHRGGELAPRRASTQIRVIVADEFAAANGAVAMRRRVLR
jgi:hypothetical protein